MFKVVGSPEDVGGDTLWASAYEAYDRLSQPLKTFVDGLTATHRNSTFHSQAKEGGFKLVQGPRGHPENVSDNDADAYQVVQYVVYLFPREAVLCHIGLMRMLIPHSPLVRTNPVTGQETSYLLYK